MSIINLDDPEINSKKKKKRDINIKIKISSVEGRLKDVFGSNNIVKNSIPYTDIRYYAQEHASSDHKSSYAQRDNAYGGMINNYTKKPKEKEIYSGTVRINLSKEIVTEIDIN